MAEYSRLELVRLLSSLEPYPAVMMPAPGGGWDVIITNFPESRSFGVLKKVAKRAAAELLTAEIYTRIKEGLPVPRPSRAENLIPDEEEPPGTELIWLEADLSILKKRLGLAKPDKAAAMKALGVFGK